VVDGLALWFVAIDLSVQLVGQVVHGRIQISVELSANKSSLTWTLHSRVGERLFFHVVDCQQNSDIHHLVKVTGDPSLLMTYPLKAVTSR
jgi:hypothetical protein